MLAKTEAVVLKSMRYRETSKIVTLYTREFGRVSVLAKGARETRNKFGGALEPLTVISAVFYRKEGRDLHLLSQADIVKPLLRLHGDFTSMSVGLGIAELMVQLAREEEQHVALFELLVQGLEGLDGARGNHLNMLFAFELRAAALLGFTPTLERCVGCGEEMLKGGKTRTAVFDAARGGFLCGACGPEPETGMAGPGGVPELVHHGTGTGGGRTRVSAPTVKLMQRLLGGPLESVMKLGYTPQIGNEIEETLRLYLKYHLGELRPLKARELIGMGS